MRQDKPYGCSTLCVSNVVPYVRHVHVNYGREIESSLARIIKKLKKCDSNNESISPRYLALNLLEKDTVVLSVNDSCKKCFQPEFFLLNDFIYCFKSVAAIICASSSPPIISILISDFSNIKLVSSCPLFASLIAEVAQALYFTTL